MRKKIKCRLRFVDLKRVFSQGDLEDIKLRDGYNFTKVFTTRGKENLTRIKLKYGNVI